MCKCIHIGRIIVVFMFIGLCGCPASSNQHTYPDDPLFVNKTPVKMDADSATTISPHVSEPTQPELPPVPAVVVLARKKSNRPGMEVEQVSAENSGPADPPPSATITFSP